MSNSVEIDQSRAVRLRCGIGHRYAGRVRVVRHEGHDMDGESFLYPPSNEYDPDTCVVCGLKTWSLEAEPHV